MWPSLPFLREGGAATTLEILDFYFYFPHIYIYFKFCLQAEGKGEYLSFSSCIFLSLRAFDALYFSAPCESWLGCLLRCVCVAQIRRKFAEKYCLFVGTSLRG